jgi:hypothetical protein
LNSSWVENHEIAGSTKKSGSLTDGRKFEVFETNREQGKLLLAEYIADSATQPTHDLLNGGK